MNQTFELIKDSLPTKLEELQDWVLSDPENSFQLLFNTAIHLEQLYQNINLARCTILGLASQHWNDFPLTETEQWDHDFIKFAKHVTGGYTRKTIDNMARVGRTWLLGELPPSIPDQIVLYDAEGEIVVDRETGEVITVEPDPYQLSVSKLLVSTAAAKNGRLENDDITLGQLFNPKVGVQLIRNFLSKLPKTLPNSKLRFILEGPYLIAKRGPEEVLIAELSLDAIKGEFSVGTEGIEKLKAKLQVIEQ